VDKREGRKCATDPQKIMQRDMLGNSDDERDLSLDGLFNGRSSLMRRNVYASGIRSKHPDGFLDSGQDGKSQVLSCAPGRHPAYDVGAPF
jgi:hypothetical protein